MYNPKTSKDTHNATSSPESAAGAERLSCPAGIQTGLFGQEVALVNPFRWQDLEKAMKETGTYDMKTLSTIMKKKKAA